MSICIDPSKTMVVSSFKFPKMTDGRFHGLEISLDDESPEFFKSSTGSEIFNPVHLLMEKIVDGTAVRLNNPCSKKKRNLYHFLHWKSTNEFFVAISRFKIKNKSDEPSSKVVVLKDVMSASCFCKQYGEIETKHYIRAGKKSHAKENSEIYYAWRQDFLSRHDPSFYQDLKLRKIEVFITYKNEEFGEEFRTTLGKPDIPNLFLEKEGAHNAMNHPKFWDWFYKSIQEKGENFIKKLERATGVFLKVIDEKPIAICVP